MGVIEKLIPLLLIAGLAFSQRLESGGKTYIASFSPSNGALVSLKDRKTGKEILPLKVDAPLWEVVFRDNSLLSSLDTTFSCQKKGEQLLFTHKNEAVEVETSVVAKEDYLEFSFLLRPKGKTILTFRFPILHFPPSSIEKLYVPEGLGLAFTKEFFTGKVQWSPSLVGPIALQTLVGEGCVMRPVQDEPVPVHLTAEGIRWLGEDVANRINGHKMVVNRPPEGKVETVKLVDSPNGALLAGYRMGKGFLFRLGGWMREADADAVFLLFQRTTRYLWGREGKEKTLALVWITGGPRGGGFNELIPSLWSVRLPSLLPEFKIERIKSAEELEKALEEPDNFPLIVNPYGEFLPTGEEGKWRETIERIRSYLQKGGIWWETGGYSFHYEMVQKEGGFWHADYPPAFSDFLYIQSENGSLAIYGVRKEKEIFVPVSLYAGREGAFGFVRREWHTYVKPREEWRSPHLRITFGVPLLTALERYGRDNSFHRRLRDKLPSHLYQRLSESVLVKYEGGTFQEQTEQAGKLPVPSLVHFADYLHGGFDKQYPDHLPPNPRKGTPEEFRRLYDTLHQLGHLVMPYTNPTWWCDDPKGPTFIKYGDAPLARDLQGEKIKEVYGANWGWAICPWHPAVREAERRIREQFTKDYPSDILFQDQIGARGWIYDLNPASPTPYAYTQGWLDIAREASTKVPLATEGGWDGLLNYETLFCGITWFLLPNQWLPPWVTLYREQYPPSAWHFYPLAIFLGHDKVGFYHHDLGQFVTNNETLTWTLLIGYSLSYACWPSTLDNPKARGWLQWLSLLQKKVAKRYFGERLRDFSILRPAKDEKSCGVMRTEFPKVSIIANTDPEPFTLSPDIIIAPYGFYAQGEGLEAGIVLRWRGKDYPEGLSFLREGKHIWIYEKDSLREDTNL